MGYSDIRKSVAVDRAYVVIGIENVTVDISYIIMRVKDVTVDRS